MGIHRQARGQLISQTFTCSKAYIGTMGAKNSLPVEAVEGFTAEEVSRLEKRFKKLDKDQSETLSVEEFLAMPELKNPIVQRVVQVFDADQSGELDFKEFVKGLAMFTMKNVDRDRKLKFLFNIYDMDSDGYISNSELFTVLKMMVGSNLKILSYSRLW